VDIAKKVFIVRGQGCSVCVQYTRMNTMRAETLYTSMAWRQGSLVCFRFCHINFLISISCAVCVRFPISCCIQNDDGTKATDVGRNLPQNCGFITVKCASEFSKFRL